MVGRRVPVSLGAPEVSRVPEPADQTSAADVPPGQAKYVCCVSGSIMDVVVDLRMGSPTFRSWESVELDAASGRALFLSEGLGHACTALSAEATVVYLCSSPYNPGREHGIQPLGPDIGITWPQFGNVILSGKDAAAPAG